MKPIVPNLRTPDTELNETELIKLNSNHLRGQLYEQFRDHSVGGIIHEAEVIAKSHGIYLEFNRALTGEEKDWMYMIRISIPGGGPLNREQWRVFDELSEKHTVNPDGKPSLRLTTRQNIQFHWVKKEHVVEVVSRIAKTGFYSLNGCGDNVRNVMGCPLSVYSNIYNSNAHAQKFGRYFRLPSAAHIAVFAIDPNYIRDPEEQFHYGEKYLNRKFKIAFSAIHFDDATGKYTPDNCVEVRTNDLGIVPILENGRVEKFQVYVGGGQGERNGKPTFSTLSQPLGIFSNDNLQDALDAVLKIHQEWGDRQNRHWARLKYVVYKQGIEWYRKQVRDIVGNFDEPDPNLEIGDRQLHHGWVAPPLNGLLAYGVWIENGRVIDGSNGELKTMIRRLMETYPIQLLVTPNQDVIFADIPIDAKESIEEDMRKFGYGKRNGKDYSTLRKCSIACVGLDTCSLSYTDSEKFLPFLLDELEEMGYAEFRESIGMSGCERQCSRPATKTIGWVGMGKNRYQLKLMGTETAHNQGVPITDPVKTEEMYLRSVPRENIAAVTAALFDFYKTDKQNGESMGAFHNRIGMEAIIRYLKQDTRVSQLMERTFKI